MLAALPAAETADGEIVVVASKVSEDYVRAKLPDGSFATESYAFGEGGLTSGVMQDLSIDHLKFVDVARTISRPLRTQKYVPATEADKAKLLIMVYWGTTMGASGASSSMAYQSLAAANQHAGSAKSAMASATKMNASRGAKGQAAASAQDEGDRANDEFDEALLLASMENRQRERVDWKNAGILGYDTDLAATKGHERTTIGLRYNDLIDELEDDRYFVVLMAYDFQLLAKTKQHKLLWETRFSIRQRGNEFDKQLEAMAQNAAKYFGQDSHGLLHKPIPEGHITLGPLEIGAVVPDK